jgi:hypothetical protein
MTKAIPPKKANDMLGKFFFGPEHTDRVEETYARIQRLLKRDEDALTAALPLLGTLSIQGWMGPEIDQAMDQAKALGLDFYKLLIDRLREAYCDLEATGEDLGIALTQAQGLAVLAVEVRANMLHNKAHKASCGLSLALNEATYALLLDATAKAALAAAPGARDEDALEYINSWAKYYEINKDHFLVFLR